MKAPARKRAIFPSCLGVFVVMLRETESEYWHSFMSMPIGAVPPCTWRA